MRNLARNAAWVCILAAVAAAAACARTDPHFGCVTEDDCSPAEICYGGECVPGDGGIGSDLDTDTDADTDVDTDADVDTATDTSTDSGSDTGTESETDSSTDTGGGTDTADDACAEVTCASPPSSDCPEPNVLRQFLAPGTCIDGECYYVEDLSWCEHGCVETAESAWCDGDPCLGVECGDPPDDVCDGDGQLITWDEIGVCVGGECHYLDEAQPCPFGCEPQPGDDICAEDDTDTVTGTDTETDTDTGTDDTCVYDCVFVLTCWFWGGTMHPELDCGGGWNVCCDLGGGDTDTDTDTDADTDADTDTDADSDSDTDTGYSAKWRCLICDDELTINPPREKPPAWYLELERIPH